MPTEKHAEKLDTLVTTVASRLTPVDAVSFVPVAKLVLQDLVEHFEVDTCFLRFNDHELAATVLVAEYPPRPHIPEPDPIGVVYFKDADPMFALTEHQKEVVITRPEVSGRDYNDRVREASGIPEVSLAAVPLLSGETTTGTLGFIKFGDRDWTPAEVDVLKAIAALLAQVQARVAVEEQLRYSADHDSLTGLSNRRALYSHLDARLSSADPGPVAILFLDLDRLKPLNDFFGHGAGDGFISTIADRLRASCAPDDLVARLGGDEFVLVLGGSVDLAEAELRAQHIRDVVTERVRLGREVVSRSVSIGVAVGYPGKVTTGALLSRGDQAVMAAKTKGGNAISVFTEEMQAESEKRNVIELSLRGAIADGSLFLEYQPEVDLRTGRIIGVEALVRWHHPFLGLLQPVSFIDVAEATNLAGELGRWVIRTACAQWSRWSSQAPGLDLTLRVNVSPGQLAGLDFLDVVASALKEFDLRQGALCLEITENAVLSDLTRTREALDGLHELHVEVAIDDFGTGFSSLSHLKALPVGTLKIDRGFVMNLDKNPEDRAIVKSIVGLAESFGLGLVAEGVENAEAARALIDLGCHRGQGFLFSRPVSGAAIGALLVKGSIDVAI
ncbi:MULTISPECIES: EAL domain-containing protein [Rhodococcus]|uniref:EAL domain-containing protein n=1 Tax=Rhodococcus oxybenzonivorans TaxID=1990687 RepID=A0AAE5A5W0_9NOCA|nr:MULTISPECIES: EAL domain-containing protein [Rhodococcus]MDV7246507.1 EAL domain-containing protein [Rhodococcus oxybenzonivorans]MDV7264503.1 EAL domain-containing protein [Rhodococcus oxybenzonivorans]MDV7278129.1 EAL domain-containing protein [Rhodococcus oxybenzonivorans]MDV7337558.1 EAL domain-containing protein [Rhodococcus oxybenzonivorans]MDV7347717.1 EAL domain-containing protein [Rhodococcus oxybenzonivorans]